MVLLSSSLDVPQALLANQGIEVEKAHHLSGFTEMNELTVSQVLLFGVFGGFEAHSAL